MYIFITNSNEQARFQCLTNTGSVLFITFSNFRSIYYIFRSPLLGAVCKQLATILDRHRRSLEIRDDPAPRYRRNSQRRRRGPTAHNMYRATIESTMAKVINLRLARKRTIRSQDEQRAAERRVHFGMPKAERLHMKTRAEKARRDLEGHRIEDGEG